MSSRSTESSHVKFAIGVVPSLGLSDSRVKINQANGAAANVGATLKELRGPSQDGRASIGPKTNVEPPKRNSSGIIVCVLVWKKLSVFNQK
jgi:hypothetical protein